MLDFLKSLFGFKESSSATAKERLRLVLLSDHLSLAPDVVQALKADLLEVIARYVDIDPAHADVTFEQRERDVAMLASIPIRGIKDERGAQRNGAASGHNGSASHANGVSPAVPPEPDGHVSEFAAPPLEVEAAPEPAPAPAVIVVDAEPAAEPVELPEAPVTAEAAAAIDLPAEAEAVPQVESLDSTVASAPAPPPKRSANGSPPRRRRRRKSGSAKLQPAAVPSGGTVQP